jgi:hypothetical protein
MHFPSPETRERNRFRARSLGAASVALAGTAVSEGASATIIFDPSTSYSAGDTFTLDGTSSSEIALVFQAGMGMMGDDLFLDAPGGMGASTVEFSILSAGMMGDDSLVLLGLGDTVDGSLAFGNEGFLVDNGVVSAPWLTAMTGYAGFQFDDGTGTTLYGWLELEFDPTSPEFTVVEWAYDDTGIPIPVGSIPEPGVDLLLAVGLSALAFWRKRRPRRQLARTG